MNWFMLLTDTNSLPDLFGNALVDASGGDYILLGILFLFVVGGFLMLINARSGLTACVGLAVVFLISLQNPAFMFLYWLGLIVGIILLINGIRKKPTEDL